MGITQQGNRTITVDGPRADRRAAAADKTITVKAQQEISDEVREQMAILAAKRNANVNMTVTGSSLTEEGEEGPYRLVNSSADKRNKGISAEVNAEREDPFLLAKANLTSSFTVKAEKIDSLPQEEVLHFATGSHDVNLSVVELLQGHEPSLNAIRIDMIKKEAEHYITVKMEEAFDLADRGEAYQYTNIFSEGAKKILYNIAPFVSGKCISVGLDPADSASVRSAVGRVVDYAKKYKQTFSPDLQRRLDAQKDDWVRSLHERYKKKYMFERMLEQ